MAGIERLRFVSQEDPTKNAVAGRLADDVAIVTGSTRGIGEGVARRLAAEGASVVVTGRSEDATFLTGESILVDGGRTAVMQDDTYLEYRARFD